jgi:superfamily II DNA or RNA helicase
MFVLRDYQRDALDAVAATFAAGVRSTLLVLPTGMGKSLTFAAFIESLQLSGEDVVLVIAHRNELLDQAVKEIQPYLAGGWLDREVSTVRAAPVARVIVSSVQTLKGKRLVEFFARFQGRVRALIIDEAHRAAAPSYLAIVERVLCDRQDASVLGVTATPRRNDKIGLGIVFDSISYSMSIKEGIERGYLVPLRGYRVDTKTSIEDVRVGAEGDFKVNELSSVLDQDSRNHLIVSTYQNRFAGRKTIVFAASVAHAEHLCAAFTAAGIRAEWACGETPKEERERIVARFRSGETLVLVNAMLYVEGFDVADTEGVFHASPTKSPVTYQQRTGRATRPHPLVARHLGTLSSDAERRQMIASSLKPAAFVVDFCDLTKRHTLESLPSLFGLPPRMNIAGRSVTDVLQRYEKLEAHDRFAAMQVLSLRDLEKRISEIDIFDVPAVPHDIPSASDFTWYPAAEGRYRLTLPTFTYAMKTNGERLDNYDGAMREVMGNLGPGARGNERIIAEERLGVRPGSRKVLNVAMEIRAAEGAYTIVRIENGQEYVLGTRGSQRDAFADADAYVLHRYPAIVPQARKQTSGLNVPITLRQTALLRSLNVPESKIPQTAGQAQELLNQIRANQETRESA